MTRLDGPVVRNDAVRAHVGGAGEHKRERLLPIGHSLLDNAHVVGVVEPEVCAQQLGEGRGRFDGHDGAASAHEPSPERGEVPDVRPDVDEDVPGLEPTAQPLGEVGLPHPEHVDVPLDEIAGVDVEPGADASAASPLPGCAAEGIVEVRLDHMRLGRSARHVADVGARGHPGEGRKD